VAYLGNILQNKLTDIVQRVVQTFATDTTSQVRFVIQDYGGQDYIFFKQNGQTALYEKVGEQGNGIIAEKIEDTAITNAFDNASTWNLQESVIVQQPQIQPDTSELQSQIQEPIAEQVQKQVVMQPIVQPIVYRDTADAPILWNKQKLNHSFVEQPSKAETWAWQNIAQEIEAKGITVYNDNIPQNTIRPETYVVITVDEEIQDVMFSDNKNQKRESLITCIIQGHGNTFKNLVAEVSNGIQWNLRKFREQGIVRNITNRNIGYDEDKDILTRIITFWYRY
jgi:hypothetical protein